MAITIRLEPQELQPVYNEVILVLTSNRKTEALFNYIVDINIDGVFSSQVKVYSNLDGYGVLDMHKHLEGAISYDLDMNSTNINKQLPNSFIKYDVSLSEQYVVVVGYGWTADNAGSTQLIFGQPTYMEVGDKITITLSPSIDGEYIVTAVDGFYLTINLPFPGVESGGDVSRTDGVPTIIPNPTIVMTGDKYAYNGVLNWLDVPNWDYTDYKPGSSITDKLLTTLPNESTVKLDDRIFLNWLHLIGADTSYVMVTTNRGRFLIENDFDIINDDNTLLSLGVGPWNLMNTTSTATEAPGYAQVGFPMFDDNTTTYSIGIGSAVGSVIFGVVTPTSEVYTFNIDRDCNKFENYKLMYLDIFGSFLVVNFDLASKKKTKVKKTNFNKNYGSYNPTTNSWGYNSFDRQESRLDTTITDSYSITTNWVNEAVGQQVIDLMESPEVYHLKEDGTLLAINITTSSLEQKQKVNDKLFNYKLGFEYSFSNTVQRG
jgi:hypothetical protein